MIPEPPLVVIEGRSIDVYASVDAMLLKLEAVDVEDGCYRVYDSAGRLVTLRGEVLGATMANVRRCCHKTMR